MEFTTESVIYMTIPAFQGRSSRPFIFKLSEEGKKHSGQIFMGFKFVQVEKYFLVDLIDDL